MRLAYEHEDGRLFSKSILLEGDLVASATALAGGATTFSATALTEVVLEALPYPAVQRLMARHIAWERVARKLFADLARVKEQREFEFLTLSAEERWRDAGEPSRNCRPDRDNPGCSEPYQGPDARTGAAERNRQGPGRPAQRTDQARGPGWSLHPRIQGPMSAPAVVASAIPAPYHSTTNAKPGSRQTKA